MCIVVDYDICTALICGSLNHRVTDMLPADHYKLATPTTASLLLKRKAEFHEKL